MAKETISLENIHAKQCKRIKRGEENFPKSHDSKIQFLNLSLREENS